VIDLAAKELSDTEKMVVATERLYGPYRWGRYDILVLPPSFPYGGMENPRLTFATPTILAGDKSLVSLVAHELAHSWSGNLVTNATWRDFWLNEGFTTYLERRILEVVYGRPREEMEAALGLRDLNEEIAGLDDRDEILHIDLKAAIPMTAPPTSLMKKARSSYDI
jgi:aminopeptidase N